MMHMLEGAVLYFSWICMNNIVENTDLLVTTCDGIATWLEKWAIVFSWPYLVEVTLFIKNTVSPVIDHL